MFSLVTIWQIFLIACSRCKREATVKSNMRLSIGFVVASKINESLKSEFFVFRKKSSYVGLPTISIFSAGIPQLMA